MIYTNNFKNRQIINNVMEKSLAEYLLIYSRIFSGLTPKTTRKLAYQYLKKNEIRLPPTWEEREEAGEDWFSAFIK